MPSAVLDPQRLIDRGAVLCNHYFRTADTIGFIVDVDHWFLDALHYLTENPTIAPLTASTISDDIPPVMTQDGEIYWRVLVVSLLVDALNRSDAAAPRSA